MSQAPLSESEAILAQALPDRPEDEDLAILWTDAFVGDPVLISHETLEHLCEACVLSSFREALRSGGWAYARIPTAGTWVPEVPTAEAWVAGLPTRGAEPVVWGQHVPAHQALETLPEPFVTGRVMEAIDESPPSESSLSDSRRRLVETGTYFCVALASFGLLLVIMGVKFTPSDVVIFAGTILLIGASILWIAVGTWVIFSFVGGLIFFWSGFLRTLLRGRTERSRKEEASPR